MSHFFAYLSRMKYIRRWSLMRNVIEENIQEHSLQVAIIAHSLAVIKNTYYGGDINSDRVATIAIFHDSSEVFTGDLPTPIKYYNQELRNAYKDVENIAQKRLLSFLPKPLLEKYNPIIVKTSDNEYYWRIVKAADKISAYIKCLEELSAGNNEFSRAKTSLEKIILEFDMPEVDFFMETFIPSFNLTLDDLSF